MAFIFNISLKYINKFIHINYVVLVREASDVLQLIDLNMEELDPFFREFNVLHTEGAEKGIDSFPAFLGASFNKNTGDSMVIILWLGGLCVFLFALLVLVLSLVSRLALIEIMLKNCEILSSLCSLYILSLTYRMDPPLL